VSTIFALLLTLSFMEKKIQVSALAFINIRSAQKTLFSGCLLVSIDIALYATVAFLLQKYFIERETYCFRRQR